MGGPAACGRCWRWRCCWRRSAPRRRRCGDGDDRLRRRAPVGRAVPGRRPGVGRGARPRGAGADLSRFEHARAGPGRGSAGGPGRRPRRARAGHRLARGAGGGSAGPGVGDAVDAGGHFPAAIESFSVGGRLLAAPWYLSVGRLLYRADLLERYRLAVPTSWEELAAAARTIQEGERAAGRAEFWGFVWQGRASEGLTANALEWITSAGAPGILGPDGAVVVDDPRGAVALGQAASWVETISPGAVLDMGGGEASGPSPPATRPSCATGRAGWRWPTPRTARCAAGWAWSSCRPATARMGGTCRSSAAAGWRCPGIPSSRISPATWSGT